jgi:hypothetical protein
LEEEGKRCRERSPPSRGRCPTGQRGAPRADLSGGPPVQANPPLAPIRCWDYFTPCNRIFPINIKAIIHEAEEGGFWAQVPAIPGCATQGRKSSSPICMRRLKAASAPGYPRRSPAGGRWASPFEIRYRQSLCPLYRAARLGSSASRWQSYGKEGSIVRLSVPIHGNAPLKTGLLRHLMKPAEISEDEF